ncbi:PadR family transcriptional regulator [candidate division WOR-3 bacterium JGI_Cruoil_03_51_56]|uniref:PadR family transcriptional regulator n=1 Tax=candidate division WOR-3 bacterium JGI_Cruoil_03_51_56 TaxID=1973747 RepID=A0A235BY72_UNCW3|nr:MAG: PadR family transcriptional regulator [candidate division WOR-3 bacterium JGI_Cruoil_03_51_56]
MADELVRDFLLGFIKLHILYHARKEPIFGQEFKKELKRHGYDISFGTLYPVFHKLERNGYLKVEEKNVRGKIRKYYSITRKGVNALKHSKAKAKELFDELFET